MKALGRGEMSHNTSPKPAATPASPEEKEKKALKVNSSCDPSMTLQPNPHRRGIPGLLKWNYFALFRSFYPRL